MLENITYMLEDKSMVCRCLEWMAFMQSDIDFWPFGGEIHQQAHWSRALILAMNIAYHEGLSPKDIDALAAAAAFHDTRRLSSGIDQGHGDRGAAYYKEFCDSSDLEFDPRAYLAIKWHDRDDEDGIYAITKWMEDNPNGGFNDSDQCNADALLIYQIFKDSDNLDRLRICDEALDMSYIRRPYSKTLRGFSQELLNISQAKGTHHGDVLSKPAQWLVVVDVQNDFVDGALGTPEAHAALPKMVEKASNFDGNVVFTKDTHTSRYLQTSEGKKLPVEHCVAPSKGWQLALPMQEVCNKQKSSIYLKSTFGSKQLATDIKAAYERGCVESVELIGLCTDICVISNALLIKAYVPELEIYVDSSCCAGVTPQKHEAALETMRSCQINVI